MDALAVRTHIVLVIMHLLDNWNWKGPRFLMYKIEKVAAEEKFE